MLRICAIVAPPEEGRHRDDGVVTVPEHDRIAPDGAVPAEVVTSHNAAAATHLSLDQCGRAPAIEAVSPVEGDPAERLREIALDEAVANTRRSAVLEKRR